MGFFSWNCPCCGHSIRHKGATVAQSAWLAQAVVVFANGDRVSGEYSGYGEVGHAEDLADAEGRFAMYHRACWLLAGKPEFEKPSGHARDQGHFFGEYDPEEPKSLADCESLKEAARIIREEEKRAWEKARAEMRAEYLARGEELPAWL